MNNTIKHAQSNQIIIQLIDHGESLMISFEDDGIGAPKGILNGKEGGLANIKERVQAMGGKCTVEVKNGKGTLFFIDLPRLELI